MLRKDKNFLSRLVTLAAKRIPAIEQTVLTFKFRHVNDTGGQQTFLDSLERVCRIPNLSRLFVYPVQWKKISLEIKPGILFEVDFDEITFDAVLTEVSVSRSYRKDIEVFTYDLYFQSESDKERVDFLSYYLLKKEEDENGILRLLDYVTHLRTEGTRVAEDGEQIDHAADTFDDTVQGIANKTGHEVSFSVNSGREFKFKPDEKKV